MWQGKDGEKAYNNGEILETKYFTWDLASQPDYTGVYFDDEAIASKLEYMTKDQLLYLKTVIDNLLGE